MVTVSKRWWRIRIKTCSLLSPAANTAGLYSAVLATNVERGHAFNSFVSPLSFTFPSDSLLCTCISFLSSTVSSIPWEMIQNGPKSRELEEYLVMILDNVSYFSIKTYVVGTN